MILIITGKGDLLREDKWKGHSYSLHDQGRGMCKEQTAPRGLGRNLAWPGGWETEHTGTKP